MLWLENIFQIWILSNLLRLALWPRSLLWRISRAHLKGRVLCSCWADCSLYVRLSRLLVPFKCSVALSIAERLAFYVSCQWVRVGYRNLQLELFNCRLFLSVLLVYSSRVLMHKYNYYVFLTHWSFNHYEISLFVSSNNSSNIFCWCQ